MARRRAQAAQEAAEADEPTVDTAPPAEVEVVTLQDVVDEALSMARAMRATNVGMCVRVTQGGRLPKPLDDYPNGLGGQTFYGVYLETEWKLKSPPFFESLSADDARLVLAAMEEQKEVTWRITRQVEYSPDPEVMGSDSGRTTEEEVEVEPTLRIRQRTRAPRGLGGGLPRRKPSSGRPTEGRRRAR